MTRDAGSAVAAAFGAPSGIYNVVDDRPLPRDQYIDALAHALGVPNPAVRSVNPELPPTFHMMARSQRVSNQMFKVVTGWQPRFPSAWQGWAFVADEWRERQAASSR